MRCVTPDIVPIFSGGTSLLKGHRLINRFSEDINFKMQLSVDFAALSRSQQSKCLRAFREALVVAWTERGFVINDVQTRDSYRFVRVEMTYPTVLPQHASLRPHILAELSAKPPKLPPIGRPLWSFVGQAGRKTPEVAAVSCVDPVETAADKLSALAWRVAARDRSAADDDPATIRHLHDLAALEATIGASADFAPLVHAIFEADKARGGGVVAELEPAERISTMQKALVEDSLYKSEYEHYVAAIAFAGPPELLSFDQALGALGRAGALALKI